MTAHGRQHPRRCRVPRHPRRAIVLTLLAAMTLTACSDRSGPAAHDALIIAAASDLMPAFTLLASEFEQQTGERIVLSFGSSGLLAQQIIEGAPIDVYASADAALIDRVLSAGIGSADSRATYAYGRITLWAPGSRWGGWRSLEDLATDPTIRTIAIANPSHAPYGAIARQALQNAGQWDALESRLVLGENVADARRFAATGDADVAIVALSLALAADESEDGRWFAIDESLYDLLRQDLIIITEDQDRAARASDFIGFLFSESGRSIMQRYGLLLPHERLPERAAP
jgi:molybdate transport system substrate-binding protein